MSFESITTNSKTFLEDAPGDYNLSTLNYSDPRDHMKIIAGSVVRTETRATIIRRKFVDVQVPGQPAGVTRRVPYSVTIQIAAPVIGGVTATQLVSHLTDLAGFLTVANVDLVMKGRS